MSDDKVSEAFLAVYDISDLDTALDEPEPEIGPRFKLRVLLVDPAPPIDIEKGLREAKPGALEKAAARASIAFEGAGLVGVFHVVNGMLIEPRLAPGSDI